MSIISRIIINTYSVKQLHLAEDIPMTNGVRSMGNLHNSMSITGIKILHFKYTKKNFKTIINYGSIQRATMPSQEASPSDVNSIIM